MLCEVRGDGCDCLGWNDVVEEVVFVYEDVGVGCLNVLNVLGLELYDFWLNGVVWFFGVVNGELVWGDFCRMCNRNGRMRREWNRERRKKGKKDL